MPRPLPANVRAVTGDDPEAIRDHILDAAHRVIASHGLASASTRAIAAEAEIGSGTIYNYFDGRMQLVAQAILHHTHQLAQPLSAFPDRAGTATVAENLRHFARLVDSVLVEVVPLVAAAFADPELLETLRLEMTANDPSAMGAAVVTSYLRAERDLGRVSKHADCAAAASTVVSLCHDLAFQRYLHGHTGPRRVPTKQLDLICSALS